MNEVEQFLQELWAQGIEVWPEQGQLLCHGPEATLTAPLLAQIKAQKPALLAALQRQQLAPLSIGQKGLWFLQQRAPESTAYHAALAFRIHSAVDTTALQSAWQLLVNRHAALRTTFPLRDGEPVQQIAGYQPVTLAVSDGSAWAPDEFYAQVKAAHERPFDLAHEIMRVTLFTRAADDHVLLLSAHHIAVDAWSLYVLLDELRLLYPAIVEGMPVQLPPITTTYTDYVAWQADLLRTEGDRLWNYWRGQLAGELPTLQLPTDYPRPRLQNFQGATHSFALPLLLTQQLKQLAQQEGVTLYMVLLAAFQVLLHRYTGQTDLWVGSPLAGRAQPEFANVVGYITTPAVMRAQLGGATGVFTLRDLLAQVRTTVLAALDHQNYPVPLLVERLHPERDPSRSPLYQADFVFQRPHRAQALLQQTQSGQRIDWGGLCLSSFDLPVRAGQNDLALELLETEDGLRGLFKYATSLFAPATIARMSGHFQTLLEGIVTNNFQAIGQPIAALPLLTAAERHQLLVEWNAPPLNHDEARCIHHCFEEQVARTPAAWAVICPENQRGEIQVASGEWRVANGANRVVAETLENRQPSIVNRLTYGELNVRANQLAHYLRSRGVGPGTLVALCVERSLEMIVGLLGVLKAGAAYVPLEPSWPAKRLALLCQQTTARVVVTQSHFAVRFPSNTPLLCLDSDWDVIAQQPDHNPAVALTPEHLVYVIFTSGSTGQPKGVAIAHKQLYNYLAAIQQRLALPIGATFATVSTLAADLGNTAIFPTLCNGGTLLVIGQEQALDAAALAACFQQQPLDCLKITPSHLQALLHTPHPERILPRQRLVLGGEALSWELVAQIHQLAPACRIFNHYGPTETTVGVLTYAVECAAAPLSTTHVPLGRPLSNVQAYILDVQQQLLPVGVPGELYIGGNQVGCGYWQQPGLTAERFIVNPFGAGRLYKTGDRCRQLPDGNIEYLGRADFQVKIRGFRIELGEIESVLAAHPSVGEAVVIAREDRSQGEKQLVAYVVPDRERGREGEKENGWVGIAAADLRSYLQQRLPEYMLPNAIVVLDDLPLTPNGKVDRNALPSPQGLNVNSAGRMPRTATEHTLAAIWCDILRLERVSIDDNFFALGGHSLLAVRLLAQIRRAFDCSLPLTTLFQAPTIAQFATMLQQPAAIPAVTPLVAIQPHGQRPPFFCVPGAGGNALIFQALARHLGAEQPFYGLQAVGLDGAAELLTSVEAMANTYLAAIQRQQPHGPYSLGGYSFGGQVAFAMAQQLQQQGETVALLVLFDSYAPGRLRDRDNRDDPVHELAEIGRHWGLWQDQTPESLSAQLRRLSPQAQLTYWAECLQNAGLLNTAADLTHVQPLIDVFRINRRIRYSPTAPLKTPFVLLRASQRPPGEPILQSEATLGWQAWSQSPVTVIETPGDHFQILAEPHVQQAAAHLRTCLDRVNLGDKKKKLG